MILKNDGKRPRSGRFPFLLSGSESIKTGAVVARPVWESLPLTALVNCRIQVQGSFITCLRHEEEQDGECGRYYGAQEETARIGTIVVHDGSGDDVAERSTNAHRGADCSQGEIKAARTLRQAGNHEDRDNAGDRRRHAGSSLNESGAV